MGVKEKRREEKRIENDELQTVYLSVISLNKIYTDSSSSKKKDTRYLEKIECPLIYKAQSKIDDYFANIDKMINQLFWMQITATFERIIFNKINQAIQDIKEVSKSNFQLRTFFDSFDLFIKNEDDINNLSGIKPYIDKYITQNERQDFEEILRCRNYFSHGTRFKKKKELPKLSVNGIPELGMSEAVVTLDRIISKVTKKL